MNAHRTAPVVALVAILVVVSSAPARAVVAPGAISFQGRLTDDSAPVNRDVFLTFRVYDDAAAVTPICQDGNWVTVVDGLFSTYIDNCYQYITGQKLWVGVSVEGEAEMSPRWVILTTPYALSLVPGANVEGTSDPVLTVRNTQTSTADYDALVAFAGGGGEGVEGTSVSGIGVVGYSTSNVAIRGESEQNAGIEGRSWNTGTSPGVFGCAAVNGAACDAVKDTNRSGVRGHSEVGDGLHGTATGAGGRGVYAQNSGGGIAIAALAEGAAGVNHLNPTLYLVQGDAGGDFVVGAGAYFGTRTWRVDRTGKGFFNGGTQASGADFAERIDALDASAYCPGDVLVVSAAADRTVELSREPFSSLVAGVYSTRPAMLAGAADGVEAPSGVPLAVVGIVPTKASAENGAIARGDLLVTASTPGHAMRAGFDPPPGTILGKALQPLPAGLGVIEVLITLQ